MSERPLIAIIEDQEAIADLLREILIDAGYAAVQAPSPAAAAAFAAETAPAVILLDVLMDELSGWQILDQLRSDPVTHLTPVIITSAVYDRPGLHLLPPGGPIRFSPKPFDITALLESIRTLLDD